MGMCVLLLGYEEEMKKMFQNVNRGLSRRFQPSDAFPIEDFTDPQLQEINPTSKHLAPQHVQSLSLLMFSVAVVVRRTLIIVAARRESHLESQDQLPASAICLAC